MNTVYGWAGKILNVDLSNSKIDFDSVRPYADKFLGGRGIASRIYWEKVAPQVKAFDPANRLIFMTGPLVGTGVQGASRLSVVGKSPMSLPEGYCYGNMGGFVGSELKKAGFDGIVLEGRATKPMYLWIHDGEVELCDATSLWGQGVYKVRDSLAHTHGERVKFITTGVAGERKVRTAVLVASHDSTSTAGFGAVMASKNLKAIAIRGTRRPSVADPNRLKDLNRYTYRISTAGHFRQLVPPGVKAHQDIIKRVGKGHCDECGLECIRGLFRTSSGREGYRKCQSMEVYMPWEYSRKDEPVDTLFDAPTLCNDYSICTFEIRNIVRWLYNCHLSGCITVEETALPLSKIGTREFLERLLHSIAYREGFGDILADGLVRAGEKLSNRARSIFNHSIVPIGQGDLMPPRAYVAHSLIYAMEPRMNMPALHQMSFLVAYWHIHQARPDISPISSEVFRDIATNFWGSIEAGDLSSYDGKALAAKKILDRTYLKDSLGLCDFAWPITGSWETSNHLGDPTLEGRIFSAVTGISSAELDLYAERIVNQQRAILLREGWKDNIPDYNFTEPLEVEPMGLEVTIPGPGKEAISTIGNILDRDRFMSLLKEYYRLRGWDIETGLPLAEKLSKLGLDDLVTTFSRQIDGFDNRKIK